MAKGKLGKTARNKARAYKKRAKKLSRRKLENEASNMAGKVHTLGVIAKSKKRKRRTYKKRY